MERKYINIRFDTIHAPNFFYAIYGGARRLIGERYSCYVVQFASLASAKRAILAYKKYCIANGYNHNATDYPTACHADIGNHSAWHVCKLDELSKEFFYLNA